MTRTLLCLDHSPRIGGAARVFFSVLDAVDKIRFRPIVVCNAGPVADEAATLGFDVKRAELPMLSFSGGVTRLAQLTGSFARASLRLTRIVREHRPAAIYASGLSSALFAGVPSSVTRTPLIWHVHEVYDSRPRMTPFVRIAGAAACVAVCVSRAAALRAVSLGVPAAKCRVVHNAVPVPLAVRTPPVRFNQAANGGTSPGVIVTVGSLTPAKGHWVLVEAMAEVIRKHPRATAVVVGEPLHSGDEAYVDGLRGRVRQLGLSDAIRFVGFRSDASQMMRDATVVVHPATYEETFGLVPLEAMAAGRPVIASRVGGVPEVVVDGVTGVLVPPGDAAALATAISNLLDDEALRERMGSAGRRVAAERFGRERMIAGLGEAFRDAIGESPFAEHTR